MQVRLRTVAINIGTNLGDRRANIKFALARIAGFASDLQTSHIYESESWGYTSCNPYYNIGATFSSDESPHDIYERLHAIECEAQSTVHRNADGTYADRRLDIDIIYIGNEIYNGEIIIPHPRMHLRNFVLLPLLELTPDWRHPLVGKTIRQLASLLEEEGLEVRER